MMASVTISPEPNQSKLFAAVQHDLQGGDCQAQGAETEPIQLRRGVPRRLGQKSRHANEGKDTDR